MRILVTGAAGFIGSHLCRKLLSEGHHVIGVDNLNDYYDVTLKEDRLKTIISKSFAFHKMDVCETALLTGLCKDSRIDAIVHLAAYAGVRYSVTNPFPYEASNVRGAFSVFEAARAAKVYQVIAASTSSIYGDCKVPFKVGDCAEDPVSLYAATKRGGELIGYYYSKMYGINVTMLRIFTVYGPWGRPDMALYSFTKDILSGKQIEVYNHGANKRDFSYVDDVIQGIAIALENPFSFKAMNLARGEMVTLDRFITSIEKALGKKAKRKMVGPQAGDIVETYADISDMKKLGYMPKTSIEQGVHAFVQWYLAYHKVRR
jgi:UDP-glucuronate 4-epimerase